MNIIDFKLNCEVSSDGWTRKLSDPELLTYGAFSPTYFAAEFSDDFDTSHKDSYPEECDGFSMYGRESMLLALFTDGIDSGIRVMFSELTVFATRPLAINLKTEMYLPFRNAPAYSWGSFEKMAAFVRYSDNWLPIDQLPMRDRANLLSKSFRVCEGGVPLVLSMDE